MRNALPDRLTAATALVAAALLAAVLASCGPGPDRQPLVWPTIQQAVERGDLADVKRHLAQGADVNARGEAVLGEEASEMPLLHIALSYGHRDIVRLLVTSGADVNAKDSDGWTPLHWVACEDDAEFLIASGADVNAKTDAGLTPLHHAALKRPFAGIGGDTIHISLLGVVRSLIVHGADVNARDSGGWTPLHYAASGDELVTRHLLNKGADVNARDNEGATPLHRSAMATTTRITRLLIARGADVNARDNGGATPLHWAAYQGCRFSIRTLTDGGADVNAKTDAGATPVAIATGLGHTDAAEALRLCEALLRQRGTTR